MSTPERVSRDIVNMIIARAIALRSTCTHAQVGVVITLENRVVSTGYGGAPSGLPHCTDVGCLEGPDGGCIRTAHAEAGAIAFAARKGISLEGGTLYTTLAPCLACAKLIINAGIKRVVYLESYRDPRGLILLKQAGIEIEGLQFVDSVSIAVTTCRPQPAPQEE